MNPQLDQLLARLDAVMAPNAPANGRGHDGVQVKEGAASQDTPLPRAAHPQGAKRGGRTAVGWVEHFFAKPNIFDLIAAHQHYA